MTTTNASLWSSEIYYHAFLSINPSFNTVFTELSDHNHCIYRMWSLSTLTTSWTSTHSNQQGRTAEGPVVKQQSDPILERHAWQGSRWTQGSTIWQGPWRTSAGRAQGHYRALKKDGLVHPWRLHHDWCEVCEEIGAPALVATGREPPLCVVDRGCPIGTQTGKSCPHMQIIPKFHQRPRPQTHIVPNVSESPKTHQSESHWRRRRKMDLTQVTLENDVFTDVGK